MRSMLATDGDERARSGSNGPRRDRAQKMLFRERAFPRISHAQRVNKRDELVEAGRLFLQVDRASIKRRNGITANGFREFRRRPNVGVASDDVLREEFSRVRRGHSECWRAKPGRKRVLDAVLKEFSERVPVGGACSWPNQSGKIEAGEGRVYLAWRDAEFVSEVGEGACWPEESQGQYDVERVECHSLFHERFYILKYRMSRENAVTYNQTMIYKSLLLRRPISARRLREHTKLYSSV